MQILRIPFGKGLDQRTDDRLNDPDRPRATTNLQRDKEGRLVPRPGYDALGVGLDTSSVTAGNAFLTDIYSYRGDRLVGIGYGSGSGALPRPARPTDLFEHRADLGNGIDWRQTDGDYQSRLCSVTHLRNLPGLPDVNVSSPGVAAGGGLVATVHQSGSSTIFHALDPDTGRTVHAEKLASAGLPCVVCVSGTFFVSALTDTGTDISLWRYNPASDSALTSLTAALSGGTSISAYDMSMNQAGDGFTVGYRVTAGNAEIKRFDSDGAQTGSTITTAVSAGDVKVLSQSSRTHLASEDGGTVTLYTYEHSGGTLENSTAVITGADTSQPPSLLALLTETSAERVVVGSRKDSGVEFSSLAPDTHASEVTMFWHNCDTATNILGNQQGVEFDQAIWGGRYQEGVFAESPSNHSNFLGTMQVTLGPQRLDAYSERLTAGTPGLTGRLPDIAYDASTGKAYWCRLTVDSVGNGKLITSEFEPHSTERRQAVELGGALYFAGGFVQYYDGVQLQDAAFAETPRIVQTTESNGIGSLTADGVYQLASVWQREDALRNVQQSAPSELVESTLSGAEDTISVDTTTPHSPDRSVTNDEYGGVVKTLVFATSDTNTNGGDPSLHRNGNTINLTSSVEFGEESSQSVLGPDSSLEAQAFIYTQADDGIISGSLPYDAPRSCSALAVSSDRITSVGLPDESELQESMPLFPRRALTWSDSIAFKRAAHSELLAVSRQDERRFAFTRDGIYSFSGPGLDPNGNGDIGAPQAMPSDVGLYGGKLGWRSVVAWAKGVMFQGSDGLIYNLPRGGGAPEPIGEMVEDLTESYPVITSAILDRAGQRVRFTCNNSDEDEGIVLVYDTVDGEWFSEGPFGDAIDSAAMYGDQYCILISGVVYRQRASGSATFIATSWGSSWIRPNGPGGWLSVGKLWFYGEMLGDFTITPTIRYQDGTIETLTAKTVSTSPGADLQRAAGDQVTLEWTPGRVQNESFQVDWDVTALSGAATRGVAYTFWGVEYETHNKGAMRDEAEIS